ncbi:MAG: Ribosomal protein L3 [Candidatus Methanohalarchaeum thermophilum]|uniref:Large ribosomal subunit protein uL3 n=1 Tax=Methanohalarchaeum thermophilum TaxID=1903181 RepID=A0A1Q6DX00_METT1|nr:MAG: Ribosomal protein L3 [Candidatus Methanohalarchaeum thermophilum]
MVDKNRPRKGSLAFSPRKRAESEIPRIRSYPDKDTAKLLGFLGYKAGMTDIVVVDDKPNSVTEGSEITVPVTVIEVPRISIIGIRGYKETPYGLRPFTETDGSKDKLEEFKEMVEKEKLDEIRLKIKTSPNRVSSIPKKESEITEMPIGGELKDQLDLAEELLGEKVGLNEVYDEGEFVDVSAVTKGKGTEGPVKRWGVKIQDRKAQRKGKGRHIGNLGPWHPTHVRWQVPQMGQTGYHQRTELNKRIMKIGSDPSEVNPEGGFLKYGEVSNNYALLKGSVPGPSKRLVRMRDAIRPKGIEGKPEIKYISTESKQGV